MINHYNDPHEPISIVECQEVFFSWLILHQQHHWFAAFPKKDAERAMEEMHEKRVLVKASECNDLHDETTMFFVSCFFLLREGFCKFSQKKLDWSNLHLLFFRLEIHERAELGPIQARPAAPPRHGMPRVPRRELNLEGGLCKRWSNSNGFGCCQRAIASTLAGTVFEICCVILIFVLFSLKVTTMSKKKTCQPKTCQQKAAFGWWWWCFFLETCHRCPSQRVLQSLPQGRWNLKACQKRWGEKSQNFFFWRSFGRVNKKVFAALCEVFGEEFLLMFSHWVFLVPVLIGKDLVLEGFFGPK